MALEVEQRHGNGANVDRVLEPAEKGALGGKEDFRFDAHRHVNFLALGRLELLGLHLLVAKEHLLARAARHLRAARARHHGPQRAESCLSGRVALGREQRRVVVPSADSAGLFQLVVFVILVVRVVDGKVLARRGQIHRLALHVGGQAASRSLRVESGCAGAGRWPGSILIVRVKVFLVVVGRGGGAGERGAVDAEIVRMRLADIDVHLGHPEGQQVDAIREQARAAVDELGKLGHGLDQVRGDELAHPLRRLLAHLRLQLHFEDSVGETDDIFGGQLREGVVDANVHASPVLAAAIAAVQVVLADHGQLGIQRDTDAGIGGELERCAVVKGAADGLVTLLQNRVLDFGRQALILGNGLFRLLALLACLFENSAGQQLALEVRVDILLLDGESSLDGLFAGPVLTMRFALDKDGFALHAAVPTETDGLGTFRLLQTALVQIPCVGVVVVDGGDGGVLGVELLVGIEDEHGQVLEDDEFKLGDVVGVDPVLCGLSDKAGLGATGGGVALDGVASGSDEIVELGQLDDGGVVVFFVKGLGLESGVEGRSQVPAGLFLYFGKWLASSLEWTWDVLFSYIVLLDDFVKAGIVELDKLGQVVDVGNDVGQVLLEQDKLFLAWAVLTKAALLETGDDVPDLALGDGDAAGNLHGLDLLLGVDLFQLGLEAAYEARLVVLAPLAGADAVGRGVAGGAFELRLEAIVVNVVPLVLADDAGPQLLAELHDNDTGAGSKGSAGRRRPGVVDFPEVLDNQHAGITGAGGGRDVKVGKV